jgi:hypothetical protein
MFTLGREREKEHSHQYLKSQDEEWRIDAVIDAVHDLLDGVKSAELVGPVLVEAFTEGGSGVWEQTGSWLAKVSHSHQPLAELWRGFCRHRSAKVRFRAAAFLGEMPDVIFAECFPVLLTDASPRVRSKTASDRFDSKDPNVRATLAARLPAETDGSVKEAITFALNYAKP